MVTEVVSDRSASKPKKAEITSANEPLAKSGKRSAKAIKEQHKKTEKETRKTLRSNSAPTKTTNKPPRTKLERAGKKYRKVAGQVDSTKSYGLADAMELVLKTSVTKFDSTVELHFRLGVDQKQADQNIRGSIVLPSGSGKDVRVAVFADSDDAESAKKAGAELSSVDEINSALDKQQINFDVLIATPSMMPKLSKHARLLGPRGLMPNPKSGTVTTDIAKAVKEAKTGRVEYRLDSTNIVHLGIGKVSFGKDKLLENAHAIVSSLRAVRPQSLKGTYFISAYLATTMGPSIKLKQEDL